MTTTRPGGSLVSTSLQRQEWLEKAQSHMRRHFARNGFDVPELVRISIGWPVGSHGGKKAIGQCWSEDASADAHNEIFISPELGCDFEAASAARKDVSVRIIGVLAHEDVHAVVGNKAGHKKPFRDCATTIGLEGKMTATTESGEFCQVAMQIIERIGTYPAGRLSRDMRRKETTRLLKCECADCGYIARVTRKWIEASGSPVCPTDQVSMSCADVDGEEDD